MTNEQNLYSADDLKKIIEGYKKYFSQEYFDEVSRPEKYPNNFMLNNPYELEDKYKELRDKYGTTHESFYAALEKAPSRKDFFQTNRLSFGLNPFMDYLFYDYFKDDKNRQVNGTVFVIGQDWYPLDSSLENPLIKSVELSPESNSKYAQFFRVITSQNYLPIFINMVPGLRPGDQTTGNFKSHFEKDFLDKTLQSLKVKPSLILSWGAPVAEKLYCYAENKPEEFQTIKEYLENFANLEKTWLNIELSHEPYHWFMLYHPSSRDDDWQKNKPALECIEEYLNSLSPVGVG